LVKVCICAFTARNSSIVKNEDNFCRIGTINIKKNGNAKENFELLTVQRRAKNGKININ
jgi:hypothetical protein